MAHARDARHVRCVRTADRGFLLQTVHVRATHPRCTLGDLRCIAIACLLACDRQAGIGAQFQRRRRWDLLRRRQSLIEAVGMVAAVVAMIGFGHPPQAIVDVLHR
ncbi:hypothetical protein ACFQGW_20475 [Xanthomonas theicola]